MYYVRPPAEKPCLIVPGRGLPERHEPEAVVLDLMRPALAARHCRAGDGGTGRRAGCPPATGGSYRGWREVKSDQRGATALSPAPEIARTWELPWKHPSASDWLIRYFW